MYFKKSRNMSSWVDALDYFEWGDKVYKDVTDVVTPIMLSVPGVSSHLTLEYAKDLILNNLAVKEH